MPHKFLLFLEEKTKVAILNKMHRKSDGEDFIK
jgi:hypothetical protein